ncbi:MAG: putative sulfate transporter [Gemmatales bacterium]|nr:MAG: putative sulfate transporter [Gemmatales bacterium]
MIRLAASKDYDFSAWKRDLAAGLTVAAVAVPQGMAYALIAGIPPEYGLYTAIVMTALGSLFGSSSHLINGPTNAISLVAFSAVAHLSGQPNDAQRLEAIFLLAVLVGVIQIAIALLKLGDLTRYISESVILGFMAGAGILIALGQVHNFLGLQQQGSGHQHFLYRFWLTVTQGGEPNFHAAAIGAGTIVLVRVLQIVNKRCGMNLPAMLLALLASSFVVWLVYGEHPPFAVVGAVPSRLPGLHVPDIEMHWVWELSSSALAIAFLGLLEALAVAKSISAQTRQPLDYNRQCLAEGLANLGSGFFQCMPGSGSLTRSSINYQAGAVTRLSGIISAAGVACVLVVFAPLARFVPNASLAAILFVTAWQLIDWERLRFCLQATRFDAGIALITLAATIGISVEFSILIGTFLSFLFYVPRAARLRATELTVSAERVVRERQENDPRCNKMVLMSIEGEMFFGASPDLQDLLADIERRVKEGARVVVLRIKYVRNVDMVCLEILQRFLQDMKREGVPVLLCGVREDFARVLRNVRFHRWLPADHLFREAAAPYSSTLEAVRFAYELLGDDLCSTCPKRGQELDPSWYYMI